MIQNLVHTGVDLRELCISSSSYFHSLREITPFRTMEQDNNLHVINSCLNIVSYTLIHGLEKLRLNIIHKLGLNNQDY